MVIFRCYVSLPEGIPVYQKPRISHPEVPFSIPQHVCVIDVHSQKSLLKPWENHGKTMGTWWFDGILRDLPPGNLT